VAFFLFAVSLLSIRKVIGLKSFPEPVTIIPDQSEGTLSRLRISRIEVIVDRRPILLDASNSP
jgi:hypothetical protein